MGGSTTSAHDGPGQALFRFVRYWSRRSIVAGHVVDPERLAHGRDVMVTEAVQALRDRGRPTVNGVAEQLGIDQSGASRFVTQAVERGYLRKISSPSDSRQKLLDVTPDGAALVQAAHEWQEAIFAELASDFSEAEIQQFHRFMERLVAAGETSSEANADRSRP
ncbi:MAG: MarR family transcriptional regulator [Actinomycetota bacterium]|nr:MAG: MarR family transcriptional regulator [Actinomycetota bacterium]